MKDYIRVIPRDLFNESKLLKCLGRLALLHHEGRDEGKLQIRHTNPSHGFIIMQDPSDGSIFCKNIHVIANKKKIHLASSLNCKSTYPLTFQIDDEISDVFDDEGQFSADFRRATKMSPLTT